MNEATANIIDFLNRYELDFGSSLGDAEILTDAAMLRDNIAHLLVQPPIWVSAEYAAQLRASITDADWSFVAEEQQRRIAAADTLQAGSENQGAAIAAPTASPAA